MVMKRLKTGPDDPATTTRCCEPFRMVLSLRCLTLSFVTSCVFSFCVGRVCHFILLHGLFDDSSWNALSSAAHLSSSANVDPRLPMHHAHAVLPHPVLPDGKVIPSTIYTGKQFDTGLTTSSDSILLSRRRNASDDLGAFEAFEVSQDESYDSPELAEYLEELHEPAGHHLMVDIEHVDAMFLDSEERLATAMLRLVAESGLTMLSYHCHSMEPMGVSCVGILMESHVSFHTWPIPGAITLDIFTCGPKPLRPILSVIERVFGVPQTTTFDGEPPKPPHTVWSFKDRGFPHADDDAPAKPEDVDLSQFLLGYMDYDLKQEVASVETDYQHIEIFDVIDPRFLRLDEYYQSLSTDGSYLSQHPELFRPDRVVYLDNVVQSRLRGEGAYHETLVHPALLAHPNPKRVAIIGGGEGATLREVLWHNTIEKVTMVEIDEMMVQVSREFLPEWSDCSNLVGSQSSCFDDPRAEVVATDAIAWFTKQYGGERGASESLDHYDVIIMDALDPSSVVEFSDVLYNNNDLMRAFSNALTEDGILVAQIGQSADLADPATQYTRQSVIDTSFIVHLKEHGFKKVKDFEDTHGGFMAVWSLLIAFKDDVSSERWYADEASVNLDLRRRLLPTITGESPLRFFDGATMKGLSYPSRVQEEVFCRQDISPIYCESGHGFDPERANVPSASLEVKPSSIPGANRGLFAKESIEAGAYVALEERSNDFVVLPKTRRLIEAISEGLEQSSNWKAFDAFKFEHGFSSFFYGDVSYAVDTSPLAFINHGCNGTTNLSFNLSITEMTADPRHMATDLLRHLVQSQLHAAVYNPFIDRNHHQFQSGVVGFANVAVSKGAELLDNYLTYLHPNNWELGIMNYRSMCSSSSSKTASLRTG